MKKIYLLCCSLAMTFGAFAQKDNVGIGTTQPDQSAILDLNSSSKGLLIPRMSLEQRNTIQNPANGLMVYQTDFLSGFYYYDGKDWKPLTTATGANSVASTLGTTWDLSGNAPSAGNFLGTTNNVSLMFKSQNVLSGLADPTGQLTYFGYGAGGLVPSSTNFNTALGYLALYGSASTTGTDNVAIGRQALFGNTTGSANAAIGSNALLSNTTGSNNMAFGGLAMQNNTQGINNVAVGSQALFTNTLGSYNIGIGTNALNQKGAGDNNVAIGSGALNGLTSGSQNTAVGSNAGDLLATGSGNTFLGFQAGRNESGSNKLYIANSSTTTPLIGGDFANNNLKFHLGSTASISNTAGFLAIGDFSGTPAILNFGAGAGTNSFRLVVQDGILTEKLKVALKGTADWADFVFDNDYKMMSLYQVEKFVKENKHLPNVPSADEMAKNGLDVTQTSAKLMEKIEELTLYVIELKKEIDSLKEKNINK